MGNTTLHSCIEELYPHYILGACHSRMSDYMYVRNGKSRAFATIEKITKTQLRFFSEVFKCRTNLLLTDILRHANSKTAASKIQRFCLCLRLDNDINEAISPPSSPDAGQLK
jgi:hypothetical protein